MSDSESSVIFDDEDISKRINEQKVYEDKIPILDNLENIAADLIFRDTERFLPTYKTFQQTGLMKDDSSKTLELVRKNIKGPFKEKILNLYNNKIEFLNYELLKNSILKQNLKKTESQIRYSRFVDMLKQLAKDGKINEVIKV